MRDQASHNGTLREIGMGRERRADAAAGVAGAWPHLINSRLKPPRPTAICVHREALLLRLDAATRRHVTLLTAPTGSGKTTLLTQWYERRASSRAIAWLSLDELDDDPVRFFSYLIGAVRTVIPAFDPSIAGRRDDEDARLIATAAAVIGERLNAVDCELTILIDDFQCVASPLLVRSFDYLLRGSPPNVHWLIAGRGLPDVQLGRLRVSDQLAVLDAEDLSFDSALIFELGRRLSERALSMEDAQLIRERTEGWVAGAKLALLANAEPQGAADALQRFAGSHAEVARYLGESVLNDQPAPIRRFLLASSIVDRMTGELCDALLGVADSQSTLERLENAQLFIQALDNHHCWYRYHALFRDFLRACLRRDCAAQLPPLHERASRWYAEHQMLTEALEHAFESRNCAWRNELLVRCIGAWLQTAKSRRFCTGVSG